MSNRVEWTCDICAMKGYSAQGDGRPEGWSGIEAEITWYGPHDDIGVELDLCEGCRGQVHAGLTSLLNLPDEDAA